MLVCFVQSSSGVETGSLVHVSSPSPSPLSLSCLSPPPAAPSSKRGTSSTTPSASCATTAASTWSREATSSSRTICTVRPTPRPECSRPRATTWWPSTQTPRWSWCEEEELEELQLQLQREVTGRATCGRTGLLSVRADLYQVLSKRDVNIGSVWS